MRCEEVVELMYAVVDEPSAGHNDVGLLEHFRRCEKCRAEFQKLKRLDDVLRSVRHPPVPRTRLQETLGLVLGEMRARNSATSSLLRAMVPWLAAAAVALMMTGGAFLTGLHLARPAKQAPVPAPAALPAQAAVNGSPSEDVYAAAAFDAARVVSVRSDYLEENLIDADLALAQADRPALKALIFSSMSKVVLAALQESVGRGDAEDATILGQGYATILRDGLIPNLAEAAAEQNGQSDSPVVEVLEDNREVLARLTAGKPAQEQAALAAALEVSQESLRTARNANVARPEDAGWRGSQVKNASLRDRSTVNALIDCGVAFGRDVNPVEKAGHFERIAGALAQAAEQAVDEGRHGRAGWLAGQFSKVAEKGVFPLLDKAQKGDVRGLENAIQKHMESMEQHEQVLQRVLAKVPEQAREGIRAVDASKLGRQNSLQRLRENLAKHQAKESEKASGAAESRGAPERPGEAKGRDDKPQHKPSNGDTEDVSDTDGRGHGRGNLKTNKGGQPPKEEAEPDGPERGHGSGRDKNQKGGPARDQEKESHGRARP